MVLNLIVALLGLVMGLALGIWMTAWHLEAVKKAAWAERQKTEHWKWEYEELRIRSISQEMGIDPPLMSVELMDRIYWNGADKSKRNGEKT